VVHLLNSIIADAKTNELEITGNGYFGGYNIWSNGSMKINGKPAKLQEWASSKGIEERSLFCKPGLVDGIGPQLEPNSSARGQAYWSKDTATWLKNSGFIRDDAKPYRNANIGVDFSAMSDKDNKLPLSHK
jgi:hypothetical protein